MNAKPASLWRLPLLTLGWMLIALAPVVGLLPGPGGIFVFAGGLILLLRNSIWARRRYAGLKRRWPRLGRVVDRVMRPRAARRHAAVAQRD